MTIQIPTSNSAGVPDEAWLAQLASSLFGTLPQEAPSTKDIPPSIALLPSSDVQHLVNAPALVQRLPALVASSAATGTVFPKDWYGGKRRILFLRKIYFLEPELEISQCYSSLSGRNMF